MQLAGGDDDGGDKAKGGSDNEGLSTPDILNKLYQDVEKDFQVRYDFWLNRDKDGG